MEFASASGRENTDRGARSDGRGQSGTLRSAASNEELRASNEELQAINGYALAQTLLSHVNTAQLPKIALTGFEREVDIERAHAAGFDAHLTKP